MARTTPRPRPTATQTLMPLTRYCPTCGNTMWAASHNYRTITTLTDVRRLTLNIRHCITPNCPQFRHPYRPEAEGRLALPKHEFGLDIIALIGTLRHAQHRSVPERHHELARRRIAIAPRTVLHLLERSDELVALSLADPLRLTRVTKTHGRVILARDGVQPDVGHEVLWVLRDCLSSEVLLARSMLSATRDDLAELLRAVKQPLGVPIVGGISDGQPSSRRAVATAVPEVPHQLCHFHYLREAAKPVYEADRHAKKALKKRVRGVCAPLHGSWTSGRTRKPRLGAAIAVPCAVPSPPLAIRRWPPQGSRCTTDSLPSPTAWTGSKQGGVAQTPRAAAGDPPTGGNRDGLPVARGARRLALGPSGGPRPHQRGPTSRGGRQTSSERRTGRDDAAPSCRWGPRPGPGQRPENLAQ